MGQSELERYRDNVETSVFSVMAFVKLELAESLVMTEGGLSFLLRSGGKVFTV